MSGFVYLASPLAAPSRRIRKVRFQQTVEATGRLIEKGFVVFSPIVHNFTVSLKSKMRMEFEDWRKYDFTMIDASRELWVLNIDGWSESVGVAEELNHAHWNAHPTYFVDYKTLKITKLDVPEILNGRLWATKNLDEHDNAIDP